MKTQTYTPNVKVAALGRILAAVVAMTIRENAAKLAGAKRRKHLIMGSSGCGKTEGAFQAAEKIRRSLPPGTSFAVYYWPANALGPAELNGILAALKEGDREIARFIRVGALPTPVEEGGPEYCVWIIDEFDKAAEDGQAGLAALLTSWQTAGGDKLPPYLTVIATANRSQDNAGGNEMLSYTSRRFRWHEVRSDHRDTCDYWASVGLSMDLIGYIRHKPGALDGDPEVPGPQACARQWASTDDAWRIYEEVLLSTTPTVPGEYTDEQIKIRDRAKEEFTYELASAVGEGLAIEAAAYMDVHAKLPPMADMLEGRSLVAPSRNDLPLTWNIISGFASVFVHAAPGADRRKIASGIARWILEARTAEGGTLDAEWTVALLRDCRRFDGAALREGAGEERWLRLAYLLKESRRYEGDMDAEDVVEVIPSNVQPAAKAARRTK